MALGRSPTTNTTSAAIVAVLLATSSLSLLPTVSTLEAPSYNERLQSFAGIISRMHSLNRSDISDTTFQLLQLFQMTSSDLYDALMNAVTSIASETNDAMVASENAQGQNINGSCLEHLDAILKGVLAREMWAFKMLDAMGKPLPGILDANLNWPGLYEQCLTIRANITTSPDSPSFLAGQYCALVKPAPPVGGFYAPTVTVGLCVPDTCSSEALTSLVQTLMKDLNMTSLFDAYVSCTTPDKPLNTKAIVAIVICSIILFLMVVGTTADVVYAMMAQRSSQRSDDDDLGIATCKDPAINAEGQPLLPGSETVNTIWEKPAMGTGMKLLISFSVYTNGAKLLSTEQASDNLTCVHGIRFLSICWVMLGHCWTMPCEGGRNIIDYHKKLTSEWAYQVITNATLSVDTFFLLSGLLVAYLSLRELKKNKGKLNWFLFYFHRFWRLTPAYMLSLMVYTCLAPYWGSGPLWPAKFSDEDACADHWWGNLLYFNNFFGYTDRCFGHSWYLANDMQFYVLSPLILLPLFLSPFWGGVVCAVFMLATAIVPGVLSQHYKLAAGVMPSIMEGVETNNPNKILDYMTIYYDKPYNRMGAYIVGMLAGYFLYRCNRKLQIRWHINLLVWSVATACALAVLYGPFEASNGHPFSVPVAALYNAVSRQVWAACVAWVVIACVTDNGGFINRLMSWSGFVPVSRLTYCIYLLHIMIIDLCLFNRQTVIYLTDLNLLMFFLSVLVLSCATAFVASMAFEAPMMGLEKVLLPRKPAQNKEMKQTDP